MRALLIGYGKMGTLIAQHAPHFGFTVSTIVDHRVHRDEIAKEITVFQSLVPEALHSCDIAFDFAKPSGITSRISLLAQAKKPVVIGTTGWDDSLNDAKQIASHYNASVCAAPNFSLGVGLFLHLAQNAAQLFSSFPQYDVGIQELHHRQKQDAPSGTANALAQKVQQAYPTRHLEKEVPHTSALAPHDIHISSFRTGYFPGTHELLFDSLEDTITISHVARNRDGFAKGALLAAQWLKDKTGWFTLDDMIKDILQMKGLSL